MRPQTWRCASLACLALSCDSDRSPETTQSVGVKLPADYRDWRLISVASVNEPLNDLRAKLGNDIAIHAYRTGTRPFPDGTIIARLAWKQTVSERNNKALDGKAPPDVMAHSFIAGQPTNVQLMIKDSKRYAETGGWGFAQFAEGKPAPQAVHETCFKCHEPAKDRDFVFTEYAP